MQKVPEGYKKTEVGVIPVDWEVDKLGKVTDVRDGTHDSPKQSNEGVPFITSKNLKENKIDLTEITYISFENHKEISKRSKVENGDILFGMIGTIGNPVIVDFDFEISIKNVALIKFSGSKYSNILLKNILKSEIIENQFRKKSNGGVQKFIALGVIRELNIPIPPLPEQQKIAEILSSVDEQIEVVEAQIEKSKELKKGLMQKLLTGKWTLENGKMVETKEFKKSELGDIPVGWEVVKISELTDEHKQGFYTKEEYVKEGCYLIRITDLLNTKISFDNMPKVDIDDKTFEQFKVEKGDFLFARSGAIGRYGIFKEDKKAVFASYIIRFRFNEKLLNEYFGYFYESFYCLNQIKAITQGSSNININAENIKSLKIALSSKEEQQKIAEILSSVDDQIETKEQKRDKLIELKKGLMQKLLTGKIRVKV